MSKLPSIVSNVPKDVRQFLDRVRDIVNGGGGPDRLISYRDLVDAGIAAYGPNGVLLPGTGTQGTCQNPPPPVNLSTAGALASVLLTWDQPLYRCHAYAEIFAGETDVVGDAVLIGQTTGTVFTHAIGGAASRYYWVRFVSTQGVVGPFNATNGTLGETGQDPAYLLGLLNGQITESQLYQDLNTRIDQIDTSAVIDGQTVAGGIIAKYEAEVLGEGGIVERLTNIDAPVSGALATIDARIGLIDDPDTGALATIDARIGLIDDPDTGALAAIDTALNGVGGIVERLTSIDTPDTGALALEAAARALGDASEAQARADALTAEAGARAAAIAAEASDRIDDVQAEAKARIADVQGRAETELRALLAVQSTHEELRTGVASAKFELTEYVDTGLSAEASARLTLKAQLESADSVLTAAVLSEQTARVGADNAIASDVSLLYAGVNANAASILSEQATRADADSALATDLSALSATVAGNYTSVTAAITAEQAARATADEAEASARQGLTAQILGADGTAQTSGLLWQESQARASQDAALSQQITLLSAGAGETFDFKTIWYFDSGVENWTSNGGTPTATLGWLRPFNHATDPYVTSPTISEDGSKYTQVRVRVRKTGTPTWGGNLWWYNGAWSSIAIDEPSFDASGVSVVTVNPAWSGTITQIRLDLSTAQDASNYFEIDWVAIGRPAPGASTASVLDLSRATVDLANSESLAYKTTALTARVGNLETEATGLAASITTEQTARADADTALAEDITALYATAAANTASITTEQTARADADTALSSSLAALAATVGGNTAAIELEQTARADADNALSQSITTLAATVSDNTAAITTEQTSRADADTAISSSVTNLTAVVSGHYDELSPIANNALANANTALEATATLEETLVRESKQLYAAQGGYAENDLRNAVANHENAGKIRGAMATIIQDAWVNTKEGLEAEAGRREELAAVVDSNQAYIIENYYTKATTDESIAEVNRYIEAKTDEATAFILEEAKARATETEALASQIDTLSAEVDDARSMVVTEAQARATQGEATASQIDLLYTNTEASNALVLNQLESYAGATSAVATATEVLRTELDNARAEAFNQTQTQSELNKASAESINLLRATVDGNQALVLNQTEARATLDQAFASNLEYLSATVDSAKADAFNQTQTQSELNKASAENINLLRATVDGNQALVLNQTEARATLDQAFASNLEYLSAAVDSAKAEVIRQTEVRATADQAFASELTAIRANIDDSSALAVRSTELQATSTSAVAASLEYLSAVVDSAKAEAFNQTQTQSELNKASAENLSLLRATVEGNQALVLNQTEARATLDQAFASNLEYLSASVETAQAESFNQTQTQATATQAVASDLSFLRTTVDGNNALALGYAETQSTATQAVASQLDLLSATVQGNNTYALENTKAQADTTFALAENVNILSATVQDNNALSLNQTVVQADATFALAQEINNLSALVDASTASAFNQTSTQVATNSAIAEQINNLSATVSGANAMVETYSVAMADAVSAQAREISTLKASFDDNVASVTRLTQAMSSSISSFAEDRTQVYSLMDGFATTVEATSQSIDGVKGQYTVKIDNNGYVTGFGLASTATNATPFSEFAVVADKFSIAPVATDPNASGSPFYHLTVPTVVNGVTVPAGTYMNTAFIADATITSAKIGNAAIDNAKIVSLSADKISAGTIGADNIYLGDQVSGMVRLDASTKSMTFNDGTRNRVVLDTNGISIFDANGGTVLTSGGEFSSLIANMGSGVNLITPAYTTFGDTAPLMSKTNCTVDIAVGEGYFGGNALQATASVSGGTFFLSKNTDMSLYPEQGFLVRPAKYILSFWAKTVSSGTTVDVRSQHRTNLDSASTGAVDHVVTSTWTRLSRVVDLSFKTGTDANGVPLRNVTMRFSPMTAAVSVYFDGFMLEEQNGNVSTPSTYAGSVLRGLINESNASTYIADAAIGNAQIGEFIQSTNYNPGGVGWRIDKTGTITSEGAATKTVMTAGNVVTYYKDDLDDKPYQSLSHVEVGVAQNGVAVTIPGYFINQPRLLVSPSQLALYDKNFNNSSQEVHCYYESLQETFSNSRVWKFTPYAMLAIAGGELTYNPGSSYSGAVGTYLFPSGSTNYTSPANTTKIVATVSAIGRYFHERRWSSSYYWRTYCSIRIHYRLVGTSTWSTTAQTALSAISTAWQTASVSTPVLPLGAYEFRVESAITSGSEFEYGDYTDTTISTILNAYVLTTDQHQVLAQGTLNWMAVGA